MMVVWWLVRRVCCPWYIGDCHHQWTGNPVLNLLLSWNDGGYWTLLKCSMQTSKMKLWFEHTWTILNHFDKNGSSWGSISVGPRNSTGSHSLHPIAPRLQVRLARTSTALCTTITPTMPCGSPIRWVSPRGEVHPKFSKFCSDRGAYPGGITEFSTRYRRPDAALFDLGDYPKIPLFIMLVPLISFLLCSFISRFFLVGVGWRGQCFRDLPGEHVEVLSAVRAGWLLFHFTVFQS